MKKLLSLVIALIFSRYLLGYPSIYILDNGAAKLSSTKDQVLGLSLKNKFVKDLNEINLFTLVPVYGGVTDLSVRLLTNGVSYQSTYMFGYIRRIIPNVSSALNVETVLFQGERGAPMVTKLYLHPSFFFLINKQWSINSDMQIPIRLKQNRETEAPVSGNIYLETIYSPTTNLNINLGIHTEINGKTILSSNILYNIKDLFVVFFGIDSRTFSYGLGWKNKKFNVWLQSKHHNIVGSETTLTLEYRIFYKR